MRIHVLRLTNRQLEVLKAMAAGGKTSDIAQGLNITVGTLRTHLTDLRRSLNVRSTQGAIDKARILGLLK